jgi:hypothetical protein
MAKNGFMAVVPLLSASFPRGNLSPRHSELICDEIDPLEEIRSFDGDLREESMQAGETRGFDQTFLVADPLAALAHNCMGLFHDCFGGLPGRSDEVATSCVHARVIEAE